MQGGDGASGLRSGHLGQKHGRDTAGNTNTQACKIGKECETEKESPL